MEKYDVEFNFELFLNKKNNNNSEKRIKIEYDFGSPLYDLSELKDVEEEIEDMFKDFTMEMELEFNNIIDFISENFKIKKIALERNHFLVIETEKDVTEKDIFIIKNDVNYINSIKTDFVNEAEKLKKENEKLKRKMRQMSDSSHGSSKRFYNGISNMYGFSMGIYDEDGNKICDGYNPSLPDKRIGTF